MTGVLKVNREGGDIAGWCRRCRQQVPAEELTDVDGKKVCGDCMVALYEEQERLSEQDPPGGYCDHDRPARSCLECGR